MKRTVFLLLATITAACLTAGIAFAASQTKAQVHAPMSVDHIDTVILKRDDRGGWQVHVQGEVPCLVSDMPAAPIDDISPMDADVVPIVNNLLATRVVPGVAARAKLGVAP